MKKTILLLLLALTLTASVQAQSGDCSSPTTTRPSGVEARNITANAATIHWNAVPGAKGYAISVGAVEQDFKVAPTYLTCAPKEMSYAVVGLAPGKTYRIRVRAMCENCFQYHSPMGTLWSETVEFTTSSEQPDPPTTPNNPWTPQATDTPTLVFDPNRLNTNASTVEWPGNPIPPQDEIQKYVLTGYVIDAWHRPVAGARVKRGSAETLTDAKGGFTLTVDEAKPAATTPVLVAVEKDGYWRNASRQYLHAQDTTYTMLMLREQTVTNRVDATKGGEMLYKRFSLQLPPNGVQTEDGTPYTGTILLSVDGATPSERDFGLRMPGGDFSAIDANNNDVMLYSYGFLSAEMTTESGQKLEFRPGAEATLRFSLPWNEEHRPDSVPLWHFNESTAIWEQEGWSVKNGSIYEGRVRHFSSWNADIPTERGKVIGRVIDCNDQPVKGGWVNVGQRRVYSDINGGYWAWVPGSIKFDARTSNDTLANLFVPAMEERTLASMGGSKFSGVGVWSPKTQVLNVFVSGNVPEDFSLSIDGGQTWTQQRQFTNVSVIPYDFHLQSSCVNDFPVIVLGRVEDCRKLDSLGLINVLTHATWGSAFSSNNAVSKLRLTNGAFTDEWEQLFHFSCLQWLRLSSNQLTSMPESIDILNQLQYLDLKYNQVTRLPGNIGSFTQLQHLDMRFNHLTSLPESLGSLKALRKLELYDNHLTNLPESLGNLTALKWLDVSKNQLSSCPENLGNLGQLEELHIAENQLTKMPESTGNLSRLKNLILNKNQLTSLPQSIGNLEQLKALQIDSNQLVSLPESIGNLSQLQWLDLDYNQLTSLPESIGNLSKLRDLNLMQNQLTDLPVSISNLAGSLKHLYLWGNPIPVSRRAAIQASLPNTMIWW